MSLFRITFTLDGGYRFEGNVAKPRFNLTQAGRRLMTVERQGIAGRATTACPSPMGRTRRCCAPW